MDCKSCLQEMEYLEHKRYYQCNVCGAQQAEDGTYLGVKSDEGQQDAWNHTCSSYLSNGTCEAIDAPCKNLDFAKNGEHGLACNEACVILSGEDSDLLCDSCGLNSKIGGGVGICKSCQERADVHQVTMDKPLEDNVRDVVLNQYHGLIEVDEAVDVINDIIREGYGALIVSVERKEYLPRRSRKGDAPRGLSSRSPPDRRGGRLRDM